MRYYLNNYSMPEVNRIAIKERFGDIKKIAISSGLPAYVGIYLL